MRLCTLALGAGLEMLIADPRHGGFGFFACAAGLEFRNQLLQTRRERDPFSLQALDVTSQPDNLFGLLPHLPFGLREQVPGVVALALELIDTSRGLAGRGRGLAEHGGSLIQLFSRAGQLSGENRRSPLGPLELGVRFVELGLQPARRLLGAGPGSGGVPSSATSCSMCCWSCSRPASRSATRTTASRWACSAAAIVSWASSRVLLELLNPFVERSDFSLASSRLRALLSERLHELLVLGRLDLDDLG